jgi:hypothetical protein
MGIVKCFCCKNRTVLEGQIVTKDHPIYVLVSRLKYYPLFQAITRLGAAWYEYQYEYSMDSFQDAQSSVLQSIALISFATLTPAAGLCNFIIFLLFQPQALGIMKRKFVACWRMSDSPLVENLLNAASYRNSGDPRSTESRLV